MEYPKSLAQRAASELRKLPPEQLARLRYDWRLWCLPHQAGPDWDEFDTWFNVGGRGSGKNYGVVQEIRRLVCDEGVMRINFVGRTVAAIRDDMVRGEAGIIQAFPPHQRPRYLSSQARVVFHTGAEALLLSQEKPESLQGKNSELVWCDEFSTYDDPEKIWSQVVFSNRVGHPRKIVTTNSVPSHPFLEQMEEEAASRRLLVTRSSSFDNFANLPPQTQREVIALAKTPLGRAWIFGEYLKIKGALWRKGQWREGWKNGDPQPNGSFRHIPVAPSGGTTVVAVDPSGTTGGDETGILVVRRVGDFGFVLADLSGNHDVEVWPTIVLDAAKRYGAVAIVAERNVGLDFLRGILNPLMRSRRESYRLKGVTVDTRKDLRAIPVATQYDLGKIWHVGELKGLETQQTTWNPKAQADLRKANKKTSPGRIDALVHGINALGFHLALMKVGIGGGSLGLDLESLQDL